MLCNKAFGALFDKNADKDISQTEYEKQNKVK